MKILHIARVSEDQASGVNVIVPEHVKSQAKFAEVYFYNIYPYSVPGLEEYTVTGSRGQSIKDIIEGLGGIDLAVIHEVNYPRYIRISRDLLRLNIPYIIVPHNELTKIALRRKRLKKSVAHATVFRSFFKGARAYQCLSKSEIVNTARQGEKFLGTNGVKSIEAAKAEFSREGCKLVYIGRIDVFHKGLDRIISAIKSIKSEAVELGISIDIYGPNDYGKADKFRNEVALKGLDTIIRVHDAVFEEAKAETLLSHDIFIQCSRLEGLPGGILEAANYGLPLIITEGTAMLGEFQSSNACYYMGESDEEIGAAILEAAKDRENWGVKGASARDYVNGNYNWDKISAVTIDKYKELIGYRKEAEAPDKI